MTNATAADRDLRQRDILPPEELAKTMATIVGVGAIGRQVALQLAAIGVPSIQLIDFDTVEAVNLAPQGYLDKDLGHSKVGATHDMCVMMNPAVKVHCCNEKFRRSMKDLGTVLFNCVDSIETRKFIWDAVKHRMDLYVDGRMSAEVIRILTASNRATGAHYDTTLFTAAEAYRGSCTAKSTIFTANIAAGLMVSQFSKWLRKLPVDADVTLNLLAGEWRVSA